MRRLDAEAQAKIKMIISVVAFGTVGIFRRYIPLPSSVICMIRGLIGAVVLFVFIRIIGQPMDEIGIRKNGLKLVLTGVVMGFNWIVLFEAYNYTSVARATLYYYLAPLFLIIMGAVFLREKMSRLQLGCAAVSLAGIVLVSGVFENTEIGASELKGFILGLAAAVMYAFVMFMNKFISDINVYDKTMIQLASAGIVMAVYSLCTGAFKGMEAGSLGTTMVIILGVFHTGICYVLFFGAMKDMSAHSIAIMTYIDPVVAVILSALILKEHISLLGVIGSVLVIVSMAVSETVKR